MPHTGSPRLLLGFVPGPTGSRRLVCIHTALLSLHIVPVVGRTTLLLAPLVHGLRLRSRNTDIVRQLALAGRILAAVLEGGRHNCPWLWARYLVWSPCLSLSTIALERFKDDKEDG